ncbi:hypothetical protein GCM10010358_83410 [Streptomyces minutiscleroticus]|uniref:Uncharacterized protein n=1 Tax=Streptomyces minutiscleroticus TaxID=68238 RepID=A0A918P4T0_9ACTN|nr:hypothetical protein GCM10010358_83410 [Streptomyces minutiscleroticus]
MYWGASPWWDERFPLPWPTRIDRLTGRTVSAIHREESRRHGEGLWPGATQTALRHYRAFLARPGRYLYLRRSRCPCEGCELQENVALVRDLLELVLSRLPPRARRDLAALVAELDEELWRRTLPDPFAYRQPWRTGGWWHWRIYDETSHL